MNLKLNFLTLRSFNVSVALLILLGLSHSVSAEEGPRPLSTQTKGLTKRTIGAQYTCQPEGSILPSKFKGARRVKITEHGFAHRIAERDLPAVKGFELRGVEVKCHYEGEEDLGTSSYVYEFLRGGKRAALFTHITALHPAPNGEVFFLENLLKRKGWKHQMRLVNLNLQPKRRQKWFLQKSHCESFSHWASDSKRFVMYHLDQPPFRHPSQVCVYNLKGELTHRWQVPMMSYDVSGAMQMDSRFVSRGDLLIHIGGETGPGTCRADIIHLSTQQVASRAFEQNECKFGPLEEALKSAQVNFEQLKRTLPLLGSSGAQ